MMTTSFQTVDEVDEDVSSFEDEESLPPFLPPFFPEGGGVVALGLTVSKWMVTL